MQRRWRRFVRAVIVATAVAGAVFDRQPAVSHTRLVDIDR